MNKMLIFFTHLSEGMKVCKHCLLFPFLLIALFAAAQPTGSGRADYLQAEELRKQNKCADAIARYEVAIKAEGNNYKYYFQKGLCEQKEKRIEDAKRSFLKSAELNKDFTSAYAQLAKMYKDEKNMEQTIYYYQQASENEKGTGRKIQYDLILVNLLLKDDKIAEATKYFEDAQKLDPGNMKVNYYSGEIKMAKGDYASAKDDYERAVANPEFPPLSPGEKAQYYYALGLAYNKLNDIENAKKAWQKAMIGPYATLINQQLMKSNHTYYYKIAVSYYLNEENEESENYIQKSLEIMPTFSAAYSLRGKIAKRTNDLRGAIENFQKAVEYEKEPAKKASAAVMLAQTQMQYNDYAGAVSSLDEAITAMPTNKNLQFMKARALYGAGRYNDAIKIAEELVSVATDQKAKAKFAFLLGMAAKRAGDKEKAKAGFNGALFGTFKPAARMELDKLAGKAE